MKESKKYAKSVIEIMFIIILLWIGITSTIQRFKCDKLTDTQIFKKIPNSFILEWEECK